MASRQTRRLAGYTLAAALAPVLAVALAIVRGQLNLGHGRSADHGTGHREPDRERAAVLAHRIAAAADRQRPRRQGLLRVVDRGPGVPETDRDRIFAAFQRLGDTRSTIGIGLGLTVSRGLTEAMGGTLEPEETPGGGLTMAISVPAASRPGSALRQTATTAGTPSMARY
jgi:nitrogen-specific signal transduction histidine kinase